MQARRNRPLFLMDIAVPRNIDPDVQFIDNVYLYNMDHLEGLVREHARQREQELAACHAIIEQRTAELMTGLQRPDRQSFHPSIPPQPDWGLLNVAACRS